MAKRGSRRADDVDVYAQGVVFVGDDGLKEVHLCVGARSAARLGVVLRSGFEQLLERYIGRQDFSGRVQLVVLSEITPQTPEVWATVERVAAELRSGVEGERKVTTQGLPIAISVHYT